MRIWTHPACLRHDPGHGHPESPQRLAAVIDALRRSDLRLDWHEAPAVTREQLRRVHTRELIAAVLDEPVAGHRRLDPDTVMSADSAEAAQRAAGAVCAAVDAVLADPHELGFCAVRPPGHHATTGEAMGFCLFNSVAVGAAHALAGHGLARVAVLDFDVHHGNGTQEIFWDDPRVLYLSSHQAPLYPGTGHAHEHGAGNVLNAPLPPGSGREVFQAAWRERLLPELDRYAPQLILVSAGFDGHRLDPLAGLNLEAADYAWLSGQIVTVAQSHARGRIVSALEGGYSLTALRECSLAHVTALTGHAGA
ncbi:MAG TPA: histone deacetylase family protein [Xanthomonadaceae bacterium]|nr:histone deacetylase family protein [Xanthomonadaceae bacterium]